MIEKTAFLDVIKNPDFEQGEIYWTRTGAGSVGEQESDANISTLFPRTGQYCIEFKSMSPQDQTYTPNHSDLMQDNIDLSQADFISFWVTNARLQHTGATVEYTLHVLIDNEEIWNQLYMASRVIRSSGQVIIQIPDKFKTPNHRLHIKLVATAFAGNPGGAGFLYIDDVYAGYTAFDAEITATIKNTGNIPSNFKVNLSIDGLDGTGEIYIIPGQTNTFALPIQNLKKGPHTIITQVFANEQLLDEKSKAITL